MRRAALLGSPIGASSGETETMNFVDAIKSGFSNYVTFTGRAARSEFWFWTLFSVVANVLANIIGSAIGFPLIATLVSLALLLPGIAVSVRRLHDLDRTGWWLLIALTGVGIILLIVWDCTKGTTGPNTYGPDPIPGI
jgi:uncharacterized membrane protein YhaH (DUF805 family)